MFCKGSIIITIKGYWGDDFENIPTYIYLMTLFKFLIGNAHPFLLLEPNFTHGLILAGNKLSRSCDYTRDKVSLKEISVKLFGRCLRSRFISLKKIFNHGKLLFPLVFKRASLHVSRKLPNMEDRAF